MRKIFLYLLMCSVPVLFFMSTNYKSRASEKDKNNSQGKVSVVTLGLSESQNSSFADSYGKARLFFEADESGHKLNEKGLYSDAVQEFERALPLAESTVQKAMVYNGLSESYKGLGDISKRIEYMEKEAEAMMNEQRRSELLKQIEDLQKSGDT